MTSKFIVTAVFCASQLLAGATAFAASDPADGRQDATDRLGDLLKRELTKKYPETKIELTGAVHWVHGSLPAAIDRVSYLGDNARGEFQFTVRGVSAGEDGDSPVEAEGWVSFAAWTPALIALRRIHPGERLTRDAFVQQDVNVASGLARESRGLILPRDTDVTTLETRQTIMEGQYALTSTVQKVPDVRRGEAVRIRMLSGMVTLSTTGTAEEPAYTQGTLHVLTLKSKRELIGKLGTDGVVEVRL